MPKLHHHLNFSPLFKEESFSILVVVFCDHSDETLGAVKTGNFMIS
jgi:hypothetical protein